MKGLSLCALIGWTAFAQPGGVMVATLGAPAFATQFRFAAMHAADRGFTSDWTVASKAGETVAHRYFFNPKEQTYTGYDMVVEPGPDAVTYRCSFRDLSIGPLAFVSATGGADPSLWKKIAPPSLPHDQFLRAGQWVNVEIVAEADPGRAITDQVSISSRPAMGMSPADLQRIVVQMQATMSAAAPVRSGRTPVVSGPARGFSLRDVDLNLTIPRAKVNGAPIAGPGRVGNAAGSLVWVYVPGHGRFVLSLMPRPELGFAKMGELRGATASFMDQNDKIEVDSATAIAPGEGAYFLYVLHDPEWEPIGNGKSETVMCGSVSIEEIRALQKK